MIMELYELFKSVIDMDTAAVVICDLSHKIVYMNPAAEERYYKRGGIKLVGNSLLDCHSKSGNDKILQVVEWFGKSPDNNRVYTFYNEKENKDVYMIALRNADGELIGYYEKHEYRNRETANFYEMN